MGARRTVATAAAVIAHQLARYGHFGFTTRHADLPPPQDAVTKHTVTRRNLFVFETATYTNGTGESTAWSVRPIRIRFHYPDGSEHVSV